MRRAFRSKFQGNRANFYPDWSVAGGGCAEGGPGIAKWHARCSTPPRLFAVGCSGLSSSSRPRSLLRFFWAPGLAYRFGASPFPSPPVLFFSLRFTSCLRVRLTFRFVLPSVSFFPSSELGSDHTYCARFSGWRPRARVLFPGDPALAACSRRIRA